MNEEDAGLMGPEPPLEQSADLPFLEQAREIEKDMYNIMTTQVKLAIIQVVLATLGILTGLIIALLH